MFKLTEMYIAVRRVLGFGELWVSMDADDNFMTFKWFPDRSHQVIWQTPFREVDHANGVAIDILAGQIAGSMRQEYRNVVESES